jgi:hypothetical protein
MGVSSSVSRMARAVSSVRSSEPPAARERCPAAWIAGPSAIGSVKGRPSSITSTPAPGRPFAIARAVSWSGSPAMM